jgi:transcriptional regulator of arginine metabolism
MNDNSGSILRRLEEIRKLLSERPIHSQAELRKMLRSRGLNTTQPTLSRDIRELGLVKGPSGYIAPSAGSALSDDSTSIPGRRSGRLDRVVNQFVLSAEIAGTLVIVRTPPADASPVAFAIDAAALREVLGTIAGDDTIFLATGSEADAENLVRRLRQSMRPGASPRPAQFPARRRHARPAR